LPPSASTPLTAKVRIFKAQSLSVCPKLRPRQLTEFLTKLIQKNHRRRTHTDSRYGAIPPGVVIYLCGPFWLPQLYT
jgi:hypothetical protein